MNESITLSYLKSIGRRSEHKISVNSLRTSLYSKLSLVQHLRSTERRVTMPALRGSKSKTKTRRYKRDVDQIYADLSYEKHLKQYKESKIVDDLPDFGRWYCIECAKWFDGEANLLAHKRSKAHKRR